jgi:hypothetical protein
MPGYSLIILLTATDRFLIINGLRIHDALTHTCSHLCDDSPDGVLNRVGEPNMPRCALDVPTQSLRRTKTRKHLSEAYSWHSSTLTYQNQCQYRQKKSGLSALTLAMTFRITCGPRLPTNFQTIPVQQTQILLTMG